MAHNARDDFDYGKGAADGHAGNGDSLPDLHSFSSVVQEFVGKRAADRYHQTSCFSP
jgi:hypothetical protein